MVTLPRISLDHDWRCYHASKPDTVFSARLSEWASSPGDALICETVFDLEPFDICVRYWLHVQAPGAVEAFLRDELVGSGSGELAFDVTDFVMLEDNALRLHLDLSSVQPGARFEVWLQPVPCDEDNG